MLKEWTGVILQKQLLIIVIYFLTKVRELSILLKILFAMAATGTLCKSSLSFSNAKRKKTTEKT